MTLRWWWATLAGAGPAQSANTAHTMQATVMTEAMAAINNMDLTWKLRGSWQYHLPEGDGRPASRSGERLV